MPLREFIPSVLLRMRRLNRKVDLWQFLLKIYRTPELSRSYLISLFVIKLRWAEHDPPVLYAVNVD